MNQTEYVNCYCFNPACAASIFNARTYTGIKLPLAQVLTQEFRCPVCDSELVSKPVLEVKKEVYRSLGVGQPIAESLYAHS